MRIINWFLVACEMIVFGLLFIVVVCGITGLLWGLS